MRRCHLAFSSYRRSRLVTGKERGTCIPMRSQNALNLILSFSTATASASSVHDAQPRGLTSSAASASYTLHRQGLGFSLQPNPRLTSPETVSGLTSSAASALYTLQHIKLRFRAWPKINLDI